jgi:hypothetical protein
MLKRSMKISEYNQMMSYLTRREPTAKESKGAYDKFVKQGKNGFAKPKRDILDHINQVQHTYDGVPLNKNNKKIVAMSKVNNAKVKPTKTVPIKVRPAKAVQFDFNLLDNISNAYEPMFNYEPVQAPPAKPKNKDLDAGIASILGVKGSDD